MIWLNWLLYHCILLCKLENLIYHLNIEYFDKQGFSNVTGYRDILFLLQTVLSDALHSTVEKMKFSKKDFVSKCDQIRRKLLGNIIFLFSVLVVKVREKTCLKRSQKSSVSHKPTSCPRRDHRFCKRGHGQRASNYSTV